MPTTQTIVRTAFYAGLVLAFLAVMGLVGGIETAGLR